MDAKTKIHRVVFLLFVAFVISCLSSPRTSLAVGACSKVKIEILQELTLERIAVDAKMVITNNVPDKDLANVHVDVSIWDNDGHSLEAIFYTRVSSVQNGRLLN